MPILKQAKLEYATLPRRKNKNVAYIAAAVVVLATLIGGGLVWRMRAKLTAATSTASKPSIAVLPLQNLSPEPDSNYFSDGMTDEITTKLSKIQGINVTSHLGAAAVKGSGVDLEFTASALYPLRLKCVD